MYPNSLKNIKLFNFLLLLLISASPERMLGMAEKAGYCETEQKASQTTKEGLWVLILALSGVSRMIWGKLLSLWLTQFPI